MPILKAISAALGPSWVPRLRRFFCQRRKLIFTNINLGRGYYSDKNRQAKAAKRFFYRIELKIMIVIV